MQAAAAPKYCFRVYSLYLSMESRLAAAAAAAVVEPPMCKVSTIVYAHYLAYALRW